jgi:hypothetical protein
MKTIKVSEATTTQLDWMVLKAQGQDFTDFNLHYLDAYHYSTDWAWGGPIIEREKIELVPSIDGKVWYAESLDRKARIERCLTPLIAAMRCYVTSKLGDTIEIPLELTQEA